MEIDLVYLWVDGNDPQWQAKRNAFIGKADDRSPENCKGRSANNDELKYSLRSVEKYAPWIRKVFIITDNQTPDWLDTSNPRVEIVDLTDIMPEESLPCFNSSLIEKFLHKIPDLSEHFLYANDDMFINRPTSSGTFFADDGFPIIRLRRKTFRRLRWWLREEVRKKPLKNYSLTIMRASELVYERYGVYCSGIPHHNIDSYLKSDCQRVSEEVFEKEFKAIRGNKIRQSSDIQRVIYSYAALAEKRGHLHYGTRKESLHMRIHKASAYIKLKRYNPILFCMNDSEFAQDSDRVRAKEFLKNYFPNKSSFEK